MEEIKEICFPFNKLSWHFELATVKSFNNNSLHGPFHTSYKLRFTPLTFIKYIILQKNWSCWYPIWKISISIVYNVGFSLLPGRICVNEDFYDLLAQVITCYIFLKSDMFEKKTEWQKKPHENSSRPVQSLWEHSWIKELNYRLEEIHTGKV